jgi:hypothetical protein
MRHKMPLRTRPPSNGYPAILKEVAQRTGGQVQLGTGTLYGIVKRLFRRNWRAAPLPSA